MNSTLSSIIDDIFKQQKIDYFYNLNIDRLKDFLKEKYNQSSTYSSFQHDFSDLNNSNVHPDYENKQDDDVNGYVVAFFADISNSTVLSAYLKPKKVMRFKKIILDIFSEVILAFDGFICRYQGDAVLAFFNNSHHKKSFCCWNAILAANEILYIIQKYVKNRINKEINDALNPQENIDVEIGVKIGIDFGSEKDTVWGKVGSKYERDKNSEHTAMGFNVDVAAKIQSHLDSNQIGLGENIVNFLEVDKFDYLEEGRELLFAKKKYGYFVFKTNEFWNDIKISSKIGSKKNKYIINLTAKDNQDNRIAVNDSLVKNVNLIYSVEKQTSSFYQDNQFNISNFLKPEPKKYIWKIKNTGNEAREQGELDFTNHTTEENDTEYAKEDFETGKKAKQSTKYNGIHYMRCYNGDLEIGRYVLIVNDENEEKVRSLHSER